MKTKDAFAMRDFDKDKILSRNFFDTHGDYIRLSEKCLSDTDALNALPTAGIEGGRQAVTTLAEIQRRVSDYSRLVSEHSRKIARLYFESDEQKPKNEKRVDRLKKLHTAYAKADYAITDLKVKLADLIRMINSQLDHDCRRAFAENVRALREKNKLSQKELSDLLEISQSSVAAYESATRQPYLTMICRMALALKVTPTELLKI